MVSISVERTRPLTNEVFYNAAGNEVRIEEGVEVTLRHHPEDSYLVYLYSPRHRLGEMGSLLVFKRRAGIGTALVRQAEEDMKRRGVTTVWLNASGFDQLGSEREAGAFWRALGYMPIATPEVTRRKGYIPATFLIKKLGVEARTATSWVDLAEQARIAGIPDYQKYSKVMLRRMLGF